MASNRLLQDQSNTMPLHRRPISEANPYHVVVLYVEWRLSIYFGSCGLPNGMSNDPSQIALLETRSQ